MIDFVRQLTSRVTAGAAPTTQADASTHRDVAAVTILLAAACAFAYWQVIGTLREQWATSDTYSFGVLVPFISAYLIWSRRDELRRLRPRPSLIVGATIVLFASSLLLIGRLAALIDVQELSLIVMLMGLVALVLGLNFLRELWFPIAYLLLMLPVWDVLTDPMHYPSQVFSANIAQRLLGVAGVPVYREAVYLHLPNLTLEVASVCSGVNFLIAVVAVGVPQAALFLQGWLPRSIVIAFALAIALLSNGLRVAAIGVLSYHGLSASLHGPGHVLQGIFVSTFGFIALMGSVTILARYYPRVRTPATDSDTPPSAFDRRRLFTSAAGAVALLSALAFIQPSLYARVDSSPAEFPSRVGTWQMLPGVVPALFLNADAGRPLTARTFQAATGERIQLFIGNLIDTPPGGGITYRSVQLPADVVTSQVKLQSSTTDPGFRVNRGVFARGGGQTELIYWYELGDGQTAQGQVAKAWASVKILLGRTDTPRLIVASLDSPVHDLSASNALSRFAADLSKALEQRPAPLE
jgi:exosortase